MIIKDSEYADIPTPSGPMRLHLFRPAAAGRYPGILLYSEIYQITGPVRRMAAFLAGQGYLVAAPEVYHEFEKPGTVLAYDPAGPIAATTSNTPRRSRPSTVMRAPASISWRSTSAAPGGSGSWASASAAI